MNYGYYLEGYSNGVFLRHYIEAKTRAALERKRKTYQQNNKVANVGWVLYSFNGGGKYTRSSYKVLGQFNAKAFFEFWE